MWECTMFFRLGKRNLASSDIPSGGGISNKIKMLKRVAYGFMDLPYFKIKLYALQHSECRMLPSKNSISEV